MGYNVHITRKYWWSDDEGPRIERQEWINYVDSDSELSVNPDQSDEVLYVTDKLEWSFWYDENLGEIDTKNPDSEIISKMYDISLALNARVLGDDEESFGQDGEVQYSSNQRYTMFEMENKPPQGSEAVTQNVKTINTNIFKRIINRLFKNS